LRNPCLLVSGPRGPLAYDQSPDEEWRRQRCSDDHKPTAQFRALIGSSRAIPVIRTLLLQLTPGGHLWSLEMPVATSLKDNPEKQ
jgi:hypothetical protein